MADPNPLAIAIPGRPGQVDDLDDPASGCAVAIGHANILPQVNGCADPLCRNQRRASGPGGCSLAPGRHVEPAHIGADSEHGRQGERGVHLGVGEVGHPPLDALGHLRRLGALVRCGQGAGVLWPPLGGEVVFPIRSWQCPPFGAPLGGLRSQARTAAGVAVLVTARPAGRAVVGDRLPARRAVPPKHRPRGAGVHGQRAGRLA
jgi:hypothetical protein